jgi:hypothetical protein
MSMHLAVGFIDDVARDGEEITDGCVEMELCFHLFGNKRQR